MIQQLRDDDGYRSFLDTRTGDVIIQVDALVYYGDPYCRFWEAIIRDNTRVDAKHIDCKKEVVRVLRGYTETEVDNLFERLGEATLDGILRDYANAHIREPDEVKP